MTYTAKEYNVWKRKADNRVIGRVITLSSIESIDDYEEIELPEPFKKLIDKFNEIKNKRKE